MSAPILVMGATGRVGSATLAALRASGVDGVAFVRDRRRALEVLGDEQPLRVGDLEVTGPHALTLFDAAATMSSVLGRTITHYAAAPEVMRQGMLAIGRPEWLVDHTLELAALLREPKAAEVTDTVERIAGRRPTALADFVSDHAAVFAAAA